MLYVFSLSMLRRAAVCFDILLLSGIVFLLKKKRTSSSTWSFSVWAKHRQFISSEDAALNLTGLAIQTSAETQACCRKHPAPFLVTQKRVKAYVWLLVWPPDAFRRLPSWGVPPADGKH